MKQHVILFLAASPRGGDPRRLHEECAAIERELLLSPHRDDFRFESRWAVTVDDIMRHLTAIDPTVIHFSGTGGDGSGLVLEDDRCQPHVVPARALTMMVETTVHNTRLVVLNSCYTTAQAESLRDNLAKLECVVGMDGEMGDDAAREFSRRFYGALGNRRSIGNAVAQSVAVLAARKLCEEILPRCLGRRGIDPERCVLGDPAAATPARASGPSIAAPIDQATRGPDLALGDDDSTRLRPRLRNGETPELEARPPFALPRLQDVDATIVTRDTQVLLLTATHTERDAVLERLRPRADQQQVLRMYSRAQTYYLGRLGSIDVALTTCRAGTQPRDGSALVTYEAIERLRPRAVVAVGIAFGGYTDKLQIGDVLVSTHIIPYESRRKQLGVDVHRGGEPDAGALLLNRFLEARRWTFRRSDGKECRLREGRVLSGEKLVDSLDFKTELFVAYPEAIGGEMEGSGVYAAAERHGITEWIIVKSVCDWADGAKHDRYQPLAATAAVALVEHVFTPAGVLRDLPPFKSPDCSAAHAQNYPYRNSTTLSGSSPKPATTSSRRQIWLTYAHLDNDDGDVEFIAQELERVGLKANIDRWALPAGGRVWEAIDAQIAICDGWVLYATERSLADEACKEQLYYALTRAINEKMPIFALLPRHSPNATLPAVFLSRVNVSLGDHDWAERIAAEAEGRSPVLTRPVIEPYLLKVHRGLGATVMIEIRPRAGQWRKIDVLMAKGDRAAKHAYITLGEPGTVPTVPHAVETTSTDDGDTCHLVAWAKSQGGLSFYIFCSCMPKQMRFGPHMDQLYEHDFT